jgi:uncharacterized protein (TIGR02268 family)
MPVLSSAALVRLVLLAAPLDTSAPTPPPTCKVGTRSLELTADTPGEGHAVCIHPGLATSFFFDTKLSRLEVTGRERFRVIADETGFTLVPKRALEEGELVPVTMSFMDGGTPVDAAFTLVVHPSEAERQVEVTLQPRTRASSREGEQQARAEARRCQEEKARLEAECSGQGGLLGLLPQGLLGEGGIADKDITESVTSRPGNTLISTKARSYRSGTARTEGGRKLVRLAVTQELQNNGSTPWTSGGAVLVGPNGVEWKALGMGPLEPIAPGKSLLFGVEVEAAEEAARGTFTLKLWSQEGATTGEFFDGVTFP